MGRQNIYCKWTGLLMALICSTVVSTLEEGAGSPPFGTTWFVGGGKYKFTQTEEIVTWKPKHPQVVLTNLPEERISEVGDKVVKRIQWRSSGANKCPPEMYQGQKYCRMEKCAHFSVSCLAGTGDFRIGLYDSKTEGAGQVAASGFANDTSYGGMCKQLKSEPFSKYRGYSYRIFPHISALAEKYKHPQTGGHVACGFYFKGDVPALYSKKRINSAGNGCFQLPMDVWSTLTLSLKRISKTAIELGMEMNGFSYTTIHDWSVYNMSAHDYLIPSVIDTMVIMYPNGRRYHNISWAFPGTHPEYDNKNERLADQDYDDYQEGLDGDEIDEQTALVAMWHANVVQGFKYSPFRILDAYMSLDMFKGSLDLHIVVAFVLFTVIALFMPATGMVSFDGLIHWFSTGVTEQERTGLAE